MNFNKTTDINKIKSLYHSFFAESVVRIVTLVKFKGAIHRGLGTNIFFLEGRLGVCFIHLYFYYFLSAATGAAAPCCSGTVNAAG